MPQNNTPVLYVRREVKLADNAQWTNRFHIASESSDRLYVISQNKDKRHWGCSCPAWRIHRHCKHLDALGLPGYERPHEAKIEERK